MSKEKQQEKKADNAKEIKVLLSQLEDLKGESASGEARAIRRKLRTLGYFLSKNKAENDEDEDEAPAKSKKQLRKEAEEKETKKSKKVKAEVEDDDDEDEDDE